MSIYNDYLTGIEREYEIESFSLENEFNKYNTLFEMTDLQLTQMYNDAETKVFSEGGTYDDLTFLYTEADAEVSGKRQSILSSIFSAITKFFTAIGEKIKKIFSKDSGSDDEVVQAPADLQEKTNKFKQGVDKASAGLAKLKSGDMSGALDILKAAKIPLLLAAGATAGTIAYKKGALKKMADEMGKAKDKLFGLFKSTKSTVENETDTQKQGQAKEALGIFQKLLSYGNDVTNTLTVSITKVKDKVKNSVANIGNKGSKLALADGTGKALKLGTSKDGQAVIATSKGEVGRLTGKKRLAIGMKDDAVDAAKYAGKEVAKDVIRKKGKLTFKINRTTGGVQVIDGKGRSIPTATNALPDSIKQVVAAIKNGTFTGESALFIEALEEILGNDYVYEMVGDEIIITELETVEESVDASNFSVFGCAVDTDEDYMVESEYDELVEIFDSL